jgi:hypothetical protein
MHVLQQQTEFFFCIVKRMDTHYGGEHCDDCKSLLVYNGMYQSPLWQSDSCAGSHDVPLLLWIHFRLNLTSTSEYFRLKIVTFQNHSVCTYDFVFVLHELAHAIRLDLISVLWFFFLLLLLFRSVHNLLCCRFLSKDIKIKVYRTVILPVVLYGVKLGLSHWGREK